jgi:hypothetical protein
VIAFATSDKGGTGRSVTSSNVVYQAALGGLNVCYLDLDFGSPTSGAIFGVDSLSRGTTSRRGLHGYFQGDVVEPEEVDLWSMSDRNSVRDRPAGAGRMVLVPGDAGGGEFSTTDPAMTDRCRRLFAWAEGEFDLTIVDLSAGRSFALQMALAVTGGLHPAVPRSRWMVFHRWTMQHVVAAHGLVHAEQGILDVGTKLGHDREQLLDRIRFVRTALVDPNAPDLQGLRPSQLAWLSERNDELNLRARELRLGRSWMLGSVPLDPVLQWHEQLLTDSDLYGRDVANAVTVAAFADLAERLLDDTAWERR